MRYFVIAAEFGGLVDSKDGGTLLVNELLAISCLERVVKWLLVATTDSREHCPQDPKRIGLFGVTFSPT